MSQDGIELRPIKETTSDYERLEKRIKLHLKDLLYSPLIKALQLPGSVLQNSISALFDALRTGRITFNKGTFRGKFNAQTSKELKSYGAHWDRKTETFQIAQSDLPYEIRAAISASAARFEERLLEIDKTLSQILPAEIAETLSMTDIFDSSLWKVEKEFRKTLAGITVTPELTPMQRKRIAEEWQGNMRLWIKDFTEDEIRKLRTNVQKSAFAGNRYGSLIDTIQKSYGVTARKAKFLARQETSLLMTKFKESRYADAGVMEYRWGCVAGSKNHPVRPSHKILEGKIFRWDNPPITTMPDEPQRKNNPGQDYNCRCFARPLVRFK